MNEKFFKQPILNSPYECPAQHWELDADRQPTNKILQQRRRVTFITPIPKPRKGGRDQSKLVFDAPADRLGGAKDDQQYELAELINSVRDAVGEWRKLPAEQWRVTPETARLLRHWRSHKFNDIRPFFCQLEAVETVIWLTEVAPHLGKKAKPFLEHLENANQQANPGLPRLALKLATGAGKTTVMAMLLAWQTVNAVRHPSSRRFTRGFLIITPGLTIRDRLRVLQPNDPDSYYKERELAPNDLLPELQQAKIVITNYHAFKPRDLLDASANVRALLRGRGPELATTETDGQILQRVMPELMGMKNIMTFNDEAHHCYRAKTDADDENKLTADDRKEAKKNQEVARLWISGLDAVQRILGIERVVDLSATPFFLRGSGYAEGTLFPWTVSDFSLMDAIECGIVKLPRVPVADNVSSEDMPKFRNLWEHIGKDMPKKGRSKGSKLDPLSIPVELQTALEALYGHYAKTFDLWRKAGIQTPPCFIIVCNNTSTSKLVYEYISGFWRKNEDGSKESFENGRLELFQNFDAKGQPLPRPNTLLIDSVQLESGEALDKEFRAAAADEIKRFRKEIIKRTGNLRDAEDISDQELLREVMNTVGKPGRLGERIRCVVSVSMLTEGWDANTVTHVLGVRAFGTQLLCEQAIGRALRRQSYDLNTEGLFDVEYADVLGIPFDFTAKPVTAPPQPPRDTVLVHAVSPGRDACEIRFPRVVGYRVELPEERLKAKFNEDSILELTPEIIGPAITRNEGIVGEGVDLNLAHTEDLRPAALLFHLTKHLLYSKWRDPDGTPKIHLFGPLKKITRQWLEQYLICKGGVHPAQLLYLELADMACERIHNGILMEYAGKRPVQVIPAPFNPIGSTADVRFTTSRETRWRPDPQRCHVNWLVCDSDWEAEFCRIAEAHPRVRAYVKNHGLGLEIPYRHGSEQRMYRPDFIVRLDDGRGDDDPLHLIVEIKGYRGEDAREKKSTMDAYWIPGVNHAGVYGRWAFAEFSDRFEMQESFDRLIDAFTSTKVAA